MSKFKPGESGNPNGRPKGAKDKRTELLQAITKTFKSEEQFWIKVAEMAGDGDSTAMGMIANRLLPTLKPSTHEFSFNLQGNDLFANSESVLKGITGGEIDPGIGVALLQAINGTARVKEVIELEQRIAQLEEARSQ